MSETSLSGAAPSSSVWLSVSEPVTPHTPPPHPLGKERTALGTLQALAYTSLDFQVNKHGTNGCQQAGIKTYLQLLGTQRSSFLRDGFPGEGV